MKKTIHCPLCQQVLEEDTDLYFEVHRDGNISLVFDFRTVHKQLEEKDQKIEELKYENSDLAKLLAQYIFGEKGRGK